MRIYRRTKNTKRVQGCRYHYEQRNGTIKDMGDGIFQFTCGKGHVYLFDMLWNRMRRKRQNVSQSVIKYWLDGCSGYCPLCIKEKQKTNLK